MKRCNILWAILLCLSVAGCESDLNNEYEFDGVKKVVKEFYVLPCEERTFLLTAGATLNDSLPAEYLYVSKSENGRSVVEYRIGGVDYARQAGGITSQKVVVTHKENGLIITLKVRYRNGKVLRCSFKGVPESLPIDPRGGQPIPNPGKRGEDDLMATLPRCVKEVQQLLLKNIVK